MCGLCGFLDPDSRRGTADARMIVERMSATLRHRGPDDGGFWVDAQAGLALGHRRLAILDLSPTGGQPMLSACGRLALAFNGEIYNHAALRRELGEHQAWRGHSDTEVLLAALARWGIAETLPRLNGMFAFALWDRRSHRLTLARDRLGEKPLYYGRMHGCFLFGSELKALRAHPLWRGDVDRGALSLFLRLGYIPAPHCIYRGIRKLQPGSYLTLHSGEEPKIHSYWSAKSMAEAGQSKPFEGSRGDAADTLDNLLRDAVSLRMQADVPLGAFLSGGIDSSLVVGLMQAQSSNAVRTFSIGFHEQGYDEAVHAKAVARHLRTEHTELYVTPEETRAVIPLLPRLYDEPFADSSQIPTYLVCALARRSVTVSLSGDGGDELFAGYSRYLLARDTWSSLGWLPPRARRAATAMLTWPSARAWDRALRLGGALLPSHIATQASGARIHIAAGLLAQDRPEALYLRLVSHWPEPTAVVLGGEEPPMALTDSSQWPKLPDLVHRMMFLDSLSYLPDDILVKVDRASMGVGLEARVPLLDHRLFELAWRLPLDWKLQGKIGKQVLREILYRYVPRHLVDRPKAGFAVPIRAWLRGPLREWAEALLDAERLRREGFFDPSPIEKKWSEHQTGQRDWSFPLWNVLMFQAWLEHNADGSSRGRRS